MSWLKDAGREIVRWYLRKFPLRDGKAWVYDRWHHRLAPAERYLIVRLNDGFQLSLDLQDQVQNKIYYYGKYDERYEVLLVQSLLDRGEVFFDIGANIGYFCLAAAAVLNNTGQVLAFEPGRLAYDSLVHNIAVNPFSNITLFNLAVTDREGEAILYLADHIADGLANLYAPREGQTLNQVCQTVALDNFISQRGLPAPDFIKVDVEGAELAVLRGAAQTIARARPLLLIEMKEQTLRAAGTDKAEIQELLGGHGYLAVFLDRRKWQVTRDLGQVRRRNVLWFDPASPLHRRKVARLPVLGSY